MLGAEADAELAAPCYEAGADAYLCLPTATTRMLLWQVARAVQRGGLVDENHRLKQEQQHRLELERAEAARLIDRQHDIAGAGDAQQLVLPPELAAHYGQLLRSYVVAEAGGLSVEIADLARLLVGANVPAHAVLKLHLDALESLILGLGSRSARHVMQRADLLALDLAVQLAEGYRRRTTTPQ